MELYFHKIIFVSVLTSLSATSFISFLWVFFSLFFLSFAVSFAHRVRLVIHIHCTMAGCDFCEPRSSVSSCSCRWSFGRINVFRLVLKRYSFILLLRLAAHCCTFIDFGLLTCVFHWRPGENTVHLNAFTISCLPPFRWRLNHFNCCFLRVFYLLIAWLASCAHCTRTEIGFCYSIFFCCCS